MFTVTTVVLLTMLLVIAGYTLHKVRQIHLMTFGLRDQVQQVPATMFRQLEALHGLHLELDLKHSLPGTRGWVASPDFLLELARHALASRPGVVVECSSGTSTLVLARCMQRNGHGTVYSLEHDPVYAEQTRAQLRRLGLSDWAVVLQAPLTPMQLGPDSWPWYQTALLPPVEIDMLVIDGPPMATATLARYPAGPALFHRIADGASVFLDDAARPDEQAILKRWAVEFPTFAQMLLPFEKGCAVLTRH